MISQIQVENTVAQVPGSYPTWDLHKIEYDWQNESLNSNKIKCKNLFLTSENASVINAKIVSKNNWNYRDKIPCLNSKTS